MDRYKEFRNEILDTITTYRLPVIKLDKTTPREAVCKVFENVNTGGVPLTVFELVTAMFATYEFDLRGLRKAADKTIHFFLFIITKVTKEPNTTPPAAASTTVRSV